MRICQRCGELKSHGQYATKTANICKTCKTRGRQRQAARYDTKLSLGPRLEPSKIIADYICPGVE